MAASYRIKFIVDNYSYREIGLQLHSGTESEAIAKIKANLPRGSQVVIRSITRI